MRHGSACVGEGVHVFVVCVREEWIELRRDAPGVLREGLWLVARLPLFHMKNIENRYLWNNI